MLVGASFTAVTSFSDWLVNGGTSRDIVVSLLLSYCSYLVSAAFHGQLSHIVICMVPYLLLFPSYINTMTIFAFCNVHDISWGTKGQTAVSVTQQDKVKIASEVNAQIITDMSQPILTMSDTQQAYRLALQQFAIRPPSEHAHRDASTKREDYFKQFRTNLVLAWVLSNGLLIAIISSDAVTKALVGDKFEHTNIYVSLLMYTIAAMSLLRFAGSMLYLVVRARRGY